MPGDPFGLSGQVIEAQFRVDQPIGEGGFSVVYKGMHLGLNEWVAIKCLKLTTALDTGMIESFANRFRDESRIAYRLSQGNLDIVRSITAGTTVAPLTGALVPYMVLEWLEGMSLARDLFERRQRGLTGRTIEEVVDLFEPAFGALAYAHAQGVVHRDLKPGNLFLAQTRGGVRLKVLDFGLAKIVGESIGIVPSVQTIGTQTIVCSPSYGAPEQFDAGAGKIGPSTDVYSLGLVVLEALRDKKVRTGEGLAQCALQALSPDFAMTCHALGIKVRPQVEVALARAVAVDPATRPPDAAAFWDALKGAATRAPRSARTPPVEPPAAEGATMWDPRGAGMGEATLPVREAPRDPFMGTAVMLDAPARPAPGTLPLDAAPSPFAASLAAPQLAPMPQRAPAPAPAVAAPMPQRAPAPMAPAPQRAPVAAPMAAPLHIPAPMPPPVVPKSNAAIVVVVVVASLLVLMVLTAVALWYFAHRAAR